MLFYTRCVFIVRVFLTSGQIVSPIIYWPRKVHTETSFVKVKTWCRYRKPSKSKEFEQYCVIVLDDLCKYVYSFSECFVVLHHFPICCNEITVACL